MSKLEEIIIILTNYIVMTPKQVLSKWVNAFNAKDVEVISELYDSNAINHQAPNKPIMGKERIKKSFEEEFSTLDMVCIVQNVFEDGQWVVMEWRDPLGLRGCSLFHIVNSKIIFQRGYWDKTSFLKQHNIEE